MKTAERVFVQPYNLLVYLGKEYNFRDITVNRKSFSFLACYPFLLHILGMGQSILRVEKEGIFMLKTYLYQGKLHLKENSSYYALGASLMVSGALLAVLCAFCMPELSYKELSLYLGDYFENFAKSGADAGEVMRFCVSESAVFFVCVLLFSGSLVGLPLLGILAVYRGFAFGFVTTFFFRLYGIRALLFLLASVLPHLMITLPCYLTLFSVSLRFGVRIIKQRTEIKSLYLGYFLTLLVLFGVAVLGGLMKAYIEPLLLRLAIGVFMG